MPTEVVASYRVQLHSGFRFREAASLADYWAELGISHVYCSPYLQAVPGSVHGYDIVNHHQVNRELGGATAHAEFCQALLQHGLGQILDVVPNHMAIAGRENPWWWDVLENGPSSRYAMYFDVDWDPPEAKLRNTLLLPVLGDHYGRVLEKGELRLKRENGRFLVSYHEHLFPVSPRSLDTLMARAAERCGSEDLAFIADALAWLPPSTATDRAAVERRHRDKEVLYRQLERVYQEQPAVSAAVDDVINEVASNPDQLDALIERQSYRLAYWRTAGRELGYRRFFDINTLAGLRTEDEAVFADTHALVIDWLAKGVLDGVRVDHPDGLRDPERYFQQLRAAAPDAWIVAEKILEPGEELVDTWPIAGTTGYDFIYRVNNVFVDPDGEGPLTHFYAEFTGESIDFDRMLREKKHFVLREVLASDVNRLTALFVEICEGNRRHRDYTRHELHEVLREVIACFPIYRTYARAEVGTMSELDARVIAEAVNAGKANRPDLDADLFHFLRDILTLRSRGQAEGELVMRFQQLTGAVMAKSVEDTVFYCFNRLVSLNEVGGNPGTFGITPDEFHRACIEAQRRWPRSMLATSTHDTKRSEDVRARINLLSEIPDSWIAAVQRWADHNSAYRTNGFPDRNTEYLLYQTLVGAWPISTDRLVLYMEKASREAKTYTSWTNPNPKYDSALRHFIEAIMDDAAFVTDLEAFVRPLVEPGRINSLSQTLLKLTAPGVPDFYQGTELWDLSLVDPDNRRPVNYELRRRLLAKLNDLTIEGIWERVDDGLPKLWLVHQALNLRRRTRLFQAESGYRPLLPRGAKANHLIAFVRGEGAVTIVPRLLIKRGQNWSDTTIELPARRWRNLLTGETHNGGDVALSELLAKFPVALLAKEDQ